MFVCVHCKGVQRNIRIKKEQSKGNKGLCCHNGQMVLGPDLCYHLFAACKDFLFLIRVIWAHANNFMQSDFRHYT